MPGRVDRRRKVTGEIIGLIRNHYGRQVFKSEIKIDVRLVEAPSFGKAIFEYSRRSAGAKAYDQLAAPGAERSGLVTPATPSGSRDFPSAGVSYVVP